MIICVVEREKGSANENHTFREMQKTLAIGIIIISLTCITCYSHTTHFVFIMHKEKHTIMHDIYHYRLTCLPVFSV